MSEQVSRNGRVAACRLCRNMKVIKSAGRCGSCDTWYRWHRADGYQTITPTLLRVRDVIVTEDGARYRVYRVRYAPDQVSPRVHVRAVLVGSSPARHSRLELDPQAFVVVEVDQRF